MSILISGMKKPYNCFVCPLSVLVGERLVCEITRDEVLRWKIDFNCPIIELPPHGRLIDADKLNYSKTDLFGNHIVYMVDIEDAPTVIEAEGSE